ncbi:MAG: hypothetical protein ACOX32_02570 [Bacteroidaceae bacterium]|jgi:hypothetical protein
MDKRTIKFKYIFDDSYNPIYINGAQGGINPHGEIISNFYLERLALPNSQTQELNAEGVPGNIIDSEPSDLNQSFVRVIKVGVIMNLQTAKSIHTWLGEHIETLEKLQIETLEKKDHAKD